nr:hypothetical transcript [Hymenolepis microstoma]
MSTDGTQISNHRREFLKNFLINAIVENIDSVNIETKTEDLLMLMKWRDVDTFLDAVIICRVPNDDLNLEILANLVKRINEHFPGTRRRAVSKTKKLVRAIFNKLPVNGFDSGKAMDLRNLGRFLGLLDLGLDNGLDIANLLREEIKKGSNALRYVVPFDTSL